MHTDAAHTHTVRGEDQNTTTLMEKLWLVAATSSQSVYLLQTVEHIR